MTQKAQPGDKRSDFFQSCFKSGQDFDEYVKTGDEKQQGKWLGYQERIALSESQKSLLGGFVRKLNVLVVSGIWCGDCMRQGPMLQAIAEACPVMSLRFLENNQFPELRDEVRIQGGTRVPVVVTCSEDFFELARFGDRTLSAYRRKAESELGPACDAGLVPPEDHELAEEVQEWVDHFERLHHIVRLSPMLRARYND